MRNFKVVRFRNWSRLGKNMLDGGQFVWVRKKGRGKIVTISLEKYEGKH